ncbi:MAG: hypothetical protein S4CHLAM6_04170 [Chlamydiae bacterium]|nr:hypothetical protein [Chlamydiota bacterium]
MTDICLPKPDLFSEPNQRFPFLRPDQPLKFQCPLEDSFSSLLSNYSEGISNSISRIFWSYVSMNSLSPLCSSLLNPADIYHYAINLKCDVSACVSNVSFYLIAIYAERHSTIAHLIKQEKVESIAALLDVGVDPNAHTHDRWTPLQADALKNYPKIKEALFEAGAK